MLLTHPAVADSATRRELGYVGKVSREAGRQMYVDAAAAPIGKKPIAA